MRKREESRNSKFFGMSNWKNGGDIYRDEGCEGEGIVARAVFQLSIAAKKKKRKLSSLTAIYDFS